MGVEGIFKFLASRYPGEFESIKRLLLASWRRSRTITVVYCALIAACGAVPAFFVGRMTTSSSGITNNVNVSPTIITPQVIQNEVGSGDDISKFSDADLVAYTGRFSGGLRIFEANAQIEKARLLFSKGWQQSYMQIDARELSEFRSTFLQPSKQLRDELMKRLQHRGIFINVENEMAAFPGAKMPILAFDGLLSGPTPVANMADFLQTAASKLK